MELNFGFYPQQGIFIVLACGMCLATVGMVVERAVHRWAWQPWDWL